MAEQDALVETADSAGAVADPGTTALYQAALQTCDKALASFGTGTGAQPVPTVAARPRFEPN